jgi:hypothetical protein
VIASASTIPVAIVAATLSETKAPRMLRHAALTTAARGESARVETLVAIEIRRVVEAVREVEEERDQR